MKTLNNELLSGSFDFPIDLKAQPNGALPEKVLQFGEGNFLRGFVDWMIQQMNNDNEFNGKVVVVQPIEHGMTDKVNQQDGLYTLYLRGIQNGQVVEDKEIISSISRGINPYTAFDEYLKCAENPDLRVIVSNTTEAGIAYNANDRLDQTPPVSFPGKLTVFLYQRYKAFNGDAGKGLIIIPCELIDRNGDQLKKIVLQLAEEWQLEAGFITWLQEANYFLSTLVDRIVTGYPFEEVQKLSDELGYQDQLINTAEIFHLWVIEGDKKLAEELPFTQVGLNVIWTDDMTPYRTRKVRILNGAHTMTVLAAYLFGKDTVKECMDDPIISAFMKKGIYEEIIPTLDLPEAELNEFAAAVSERFANPFIKHYLLSIALNSTSKFKTRVLPSILEYIKRKNSLPKTLTFSLASLLAFYRGSEIQDNALIGNRNGNEYKIQDDMPVLEIFKSAWEKYDDSLQGAQSLVSHFFSLKDIWGMNLNELDGFTDAASEYLFDIVNNGMNQAIAKLI